MSDRWVKVRNSFFAGLLVVVPLAASIGILWWLFNALTDLLLPSGLQRWLSNFPYPQTLFRVLALLIFVGAVTFIGWVTRLVVGKRVLTMSEGVIARVPLLNKIYPFMKEVSHTMLGGTKTVFERVVLLEYPRPGIYAIGFVTSETEGEIQARTSQPVINVFLPTTPNPTSGFLLMVPRDQVIELSMTVAEGMKLVISGGAVVPPFPRPMAKPSPAPLSVE